MLSEQPGGYRYFIELLFDGTRFHGWQVQPGAETVQGILNSSVGLLAGEPVNLTGCGRTDAGVHAAHFVAHFDLLNPVPDCIHLASRLNRLLNPSISIARIVPVKLDAHARFDAISRTYQYLISREKNPFMTDYSWNLTIPLDIPSMNSACRFLTGRHDFTSFSKLHTDVKTNICEVYEACWVEYGGFLVFRIRADRFLRNMVRAIVGTLIEVGKGKLTPEEVERIRDAGDRSAAGMSVPAKGLFLTRVDYSPDIFRADPKTPFSDWFSAG